jgi:enterochelin esterase family protein
MSALAQELLLRARAEPAWLDELVASESFPIVRGRSVTFVWRGQADAVFLRHWIFGLDSAQAFARVDGTDVWVLGLELPEGSRVEYKLEIVRGAERRLIQDPLNNSRANDPFGSNSVVHAAGYEVPDWTLPDPLARRGSLERLAVASDVFGGVRPVSVYLPARFRRSRRYPLLVVHDGEDYLRYSSLETVLDNLIHRLEIQGMVVALIQSPDRMREYGDDERHAEFLVRELVPLLEQRYPLVGTPEARGLVGASLGAVASLAAAWRHPGFFHHLLLQSGSFVFTDIGEHGRGPAFDAVVRFMNEFRRDPGRPAEQVFVSCGMYESLIYYNRSLVPLLQATGMAVRWSEARDGHNWENWRDRLREGLSWLFPGPLWMVYE